MMIRTTHIVRAAAWSAAVSLCALSFSASANPQGGVIAAGQASITEAGTKLDIHQQSNKVVIDWRGFDIAPDEHTEFHQPDSRAIALNRVNSSSASQINGKLTANGNVVIVNQNGVMFGRGAQIDVNGIVASTADIDNDAFMHDPLLAFDRKGKADATISNEGTITAKEAGLVGFVAPNVVNDGVIMANLGRAHLASGDTATVDFYGDGLMQVAVSSDVRSQMVRNAGTIEANGGKIALTAAAGKDIVNSLIVAKGVLKAQTVGVRNGEIIISAAGSNAVKGNVAAASCASVVRIWAKVRHR
jgi:filamentous hemagglutinin family protein